MLELTKEEISQVKDIWSYILTKGDEFGVIHYTNLYKNYQDIGRLFSAPPEIQGRRLIFGLTKVIDNLEENPKETYRYLKLMGKQHRGFKAKKKHYPLVITSMKSAAGHTLLDYEDTSAIQTWEKFLDLIGEVMSKSR